MRIVSVDRYGRLDVQPDGGVHVDGWTVQLDEGDREVGVDELALMIFEYLAERTRTHMLARAAAKLTTAVN